MTRSEGVSVQGREYRVRIEGRGNIVIQAILDLRTVHREWRRLLRARGPVRAGWANRGR